MWKLVDPVNPPGVTQGRTQEPTANPASVSYRVGTWCVEHLVPLIIRSLTSTSNEQQQAKKAIKKIILTINTRFDKDQRSITIYLACRRYIITFID